MLEIWEGEIHTFECLKLGDLGPVDCVGCAESASALGKSQGVRHDL